MIEPDHPQLPIKRQCALVGISRSAFYGGPRTESLETFAVMRVIDGQFLETPRCGSRQMVRHLRRQGHEVGRKRVRRLMARMGLAAIYQRPKTTVRHPQHRVFPYLLRNMAIDEPDQVWCADITYIPMRRGFLYLVAIMDWHSRRALLIGLRTQSVPDCYGWRPTSASRHWRKALSRFGRPGIFNTDQGSQFTSPRFTQVLLDAGVRLSMDGRGRWMDNVFIERLWRSLKYECIYLNAFETGSETRAGIGRWITYYNRTRPHSALGGRTPEEVHMACDGINMAA
ncbi:IS3 family transposase [Xanthobacter autotrophicus]|uniref:IS3 family transposase n=1 Tax=Xanthobacter autotrophicus TaxID=280 RepID=UPI0037271225